MLEFYIKFKSLIDCALIIIVGYTLVRIVAGFVRQKLKKSEKNITSKLFLLSVSKVFTYLIILLTALSKLGVPITSFLTMVGAVSLAFSLAAKDTLSNLASGFMLMFSHPFDVGDFIESGTTTGLVVEIGFLYTIITTSDNKKTYIPNSLVANAKIFNSTSCTTRRIEIEVPVSYDEDNDTIKKHISKVLSANKAIIAEPQPIINIVDFASNSLVYTVRFWTNTEDYLPTLLDIREQIKKEFDENSIKMPYNKTFEVTK